MNEKNPTFIADFFCLFDFVYLHICSDAKILNHPKMKWNKN